MLGDSTAGLCRITLKECCRRRVEEEYLWRHHEPPIPEGVEDVVVIVHDETRGHQAAAGVEASPDEC